MTVLSALNSIRIIPRDSEFLNRKLGSRGEIFFDQASSTLRLYDGITTGGIPLLRADLSNAEAVIGAALGDTPPTGTTVQAGTIWFNTSNGRLYIYYNDGTSTQWVQPTTPSYGSGSGGGATTIDELSDVTITSPSSGQVLKYNGTAWVNGTDNTSGGGGSSNSFETIAVAGQSSVVADSATDTLTLVAGTGITITTVAGTDAITIAASGGAAGNNFETIAVAGQSNIVADSSSDTLTLAAGTGISITTNASTDTVTITSTVSGGATAFTGLSDAGSLTVDRFYLPAITVLNVTANGISAYRFDQYGTTDDPTIYAINATTIAFNLAGATSHPFLIQDNTGTNYNTGLVHVTTAGVVTTGSSAQGKDSGTLYWKIPDSISGNYRYQCGSHAGMVGIITIKNFGTI